MAINAVYEMLYTSRDPEREVFQFITKMSTWPHGSFTALRRQEKTRDLNHPHMSGFVKINKGKIQARVRFRYERRTSKGVVKKR